MIAIPRPTTRRKSTLQSRATKPQWHEQFLTLLPAIRRYACISFRHLAAEAREEAVQEAIANALQIYVRLHQQDKADLAYAGALARFGVQRTRIGRGIGGPWRKRDVYAGPCPAREGVRLLRFDAHHATSGWEELVVEDRRATPADVAATRLDFRAWLSSLSAQQRRVALMLAMGESTQGAARRCSLSPGRISQLRRELKHAWLRFQGQPAA